MEAVFRDQNQWLMAHTLHLFAPGIPQMYYNDILGQRNDEDLYKETGEGRSLIRHNHNMDLIKHKFEQPFVKKLVKLMEIRNNHPAFDGEITVFETENQEFVITWKKENQEIKLTANLKNYQSTIEYTDEKSQKQIL
jgi:sucrose phosphorylase